MRELNNTTYYIGVDGGGTKTHALLLNQKLEQIDEEYSGPANIATDIELAYSSISNVIDNLLRRHKLLVKDTSIGIGVAGYSVVENRSIILAKLQDKYKNVRLNSDCHIACLAAHNAKNGAVVICGTGVVAYTIYNGDNRQLGGWGFPHGDLGGAAYLGLEITRGLCKAIDGITSWSPILRELYLELFNEDSHKYKMWLIGATARDYAYITKFVFSRSIDEFSSQVLKKGAAEISQLIMTLQHDIQNLSIKLVGGLAKLYISQLQQQFANLELSGTVPAFGAVLSVYNSK